jgi:hypothetical protein
VRNLTYVQACIYQQLTMGWRRRKGRGNSPAMRLTAYEVVRRMISRKCAGRLAMFLCASVVLMPGETLGRGGGGFGGRGFGGRTVPIASHFHPPVRQPQEQSLPHQLGFSARSRQRFGYGFLPFAGYGDYGPAFGMPGYAVGPGYAIESLGEPVLPETDTTSAMPIPDLFPGRFRPFPIYHQGCQTQTSTFPVGIGDTRSINIVRCYR